MPAYRAFPLPLRMLIRLSAVLAAGAAMALLPTFHAARAQSSNLLNGQNIGAVGGAVAGAVAGKQLASKKNRTLGIAGGAVGGGLLGAVAGNIYDNSGKGPTPARREPATTGSVGKGSSLLSGQNVGIVAGAVGGGVLGNKLGGKKHKTLGTIGGVVGGGVVGGALGSAFDRR